MSAAEQDRYARGLRVRREVLGDAHVDRSLQGVSEFARPVQEYVTENVWGQLWSRPGLDRRTRSLLNLVMLTALNRGHELGVHVRGAVRNGCATTEIQEALLQTAGYCGAPAALESFRVAERVLDEVAAESVDASGSATGSTDGDRASLAPADAAHDDRYARGLRVRREVLGDAHVDRSLQGVSEFARPVQEYVTENVWGQLWSRPGLDRRTRSLLNLVMLTALNRGHELGVHVRGAVRNGCATTEIQEALLQTAGYCGAPAALESFRVAERVLDEVAAESVDASGNGRG